MNTNGIFFKKYEIQSFQKAFNSNGKINWFSFLSHLREPMGPLRRQLVEHIFDNMDKDKKGFLTTSQLSKTAFIKWTISIQMKSKCID